MNLEISKVYTFSTRSPVFLGAKMERVKLKSIADADTARKFAPIDQLHGQIYPTLPEGSPTDVNAMMYYIFEAQNKSTVVLAADWILESTIELIENVEIVVTVARGALTDVEKIRTALSAANIKDFVITTR